MVRGADVGPGGRIGGWDCSAVRIASKGHTAPAVARSSRARPFVGESMRLVREPDAGDLHVRFDERDVETEPRRGYSGTARRKGRQQTNRTYCHRATSRLYRKLRMVNVRCRQERTFRWPAEAPLDNRRNVVWLHTSRAMTLDVGGRPIDSEPGICSIRGFPPSS